MAKLITVRCPHCGANLNVDDGLDTFYCQFCGTKIFLDELSDAAYDAKTKVKNMQHQETMADKKYDYKKFKIASKFRERSQDFKYAILFFVIPMLILSLMFGYMKASSNREEVKLQKIVEEVQEDIKNDDFDSAYVKAQSIVYTADWSNDIEKKCNNIRKELINQIIEEEKKVTGSSNHKPEKSGLFG